VEGAHLEGRERIDICRLPCPGRVSLPDKAFPGLQRKRCFCHRHQPQQHQLLLAVQGMPAGHKVRIGDLAERLQIRHHSTVELVGRMEAKRLVVRVPGETDRREVHVRLTPRGNRSLRALTVIHRDELRRAAPALVSSLRKVCERSEANAAKAGSRSGRLRFVAATRQ